MAFGLWSISQTPFVLTMISPHWAINFIVHQPYVAFLTMGAVILTMTGGEAILCRYGAFWSFTDSIGMVHCGDAMFAVELCRSRRAFTP